MRNYIDRERLFIFHYLWGIFPYFWNCCKTFLVWRQSSSLFFNLQFFSHKILLYIMVYRLPRWPPNVKKITTGFALSSRFPFGKSTELYSYCRIKLWFTSSLLCYSCHFLGPAEFILHSQHLFVVNITDVFFLSSISWITVCCQRPLLNTTQYVVLFDFHWLSFRLNKTYFRIH